MKSFKLFNIYYYTNKNYRYENKRYIQYIKGKIFRCITF